MPLRSSSLAIGVLALAVLTAGCGGDDDAATTSTPVAPSTTTTAAPSTTTAAPATTETPATSTAPATSGAPPSTVASGDDGGARCATGDLEARLEPGSPGAGNRYAVLVLRNVGQAPCTTRGYPGLGLVGADGTTLPSDVQWGGAGAPGDPGPSTIELAPGDEASALLHWGAVPGEGDATHGPCQPEAATLLVTPPDETMQLEVPFADSVCQGGHIDVTALVPGADGPAIP